MPMAANHSAVGIAMAVTHPAQGVAVSHCPVRVAAPAAVTVTRPRQGRRSEGECRRARD